MKRADATLSTALVTGACSGIGLAIARRLGALGYTLVLVSHREQPLAQVADDIAREHGVKTHAIHLDLATLSAAETLYEKTQALGLAVDILVNNAGIFFFGEVADAAPALAKTMLQLHVITPSLLCTLFARDMRRRGRGHILIVSSISAWRDFPGIAYYGSSKKYLLGFARALRSELGVYGVNVTCLAPGATATSLYDPNSVPVERARRLGIMAPAEWIADHGLTAMFRRRAVCVPGILTRLMLFGARVVPQLVIDLVRRRAPWLVVRAPSATPT